MSKCFHFFFFWLLQKSKNSPRKQYLFSREVQSTRDISILKFDMGWKSCHEDGQWNLFEGWKFPIFSRASYVSITFREMMRYSSTEESLRCWGLSVLYGSCWDVATRKIDFLYYVGLIRVGADRVRADFA